MKAIMYHYVQPYRADLPGLRYLPFSSFRQQLDHFFRSEGFLKKDAFLESIETGEAKSGVVITFDDGLKSHFEYVLPELQKRNLWAFFFVPGRVYLEEDLLEVHKIHILLACNSSEIIRKKLLNIITPEMIPDEKIDEFRKLTYRNQHNDEATMEVKRILNYFISYRYRREVIDWLLEKSKTGKRIDIWDYYLTPEEMKRMADCGMFIGSHTVNHPVLSKISQEEQRREIVEAHRIVDEICGIQSLKSFCFPYGGFTASTKRQ